MKITTNVYAQILILSLLLFSSIPFSPIPARAAGEEKPLILKDPALERAAATLGIDEYQEELGWWSSDGRGGREPGTTGSVEAGERAAEAFARLGLAPAGDRVNGDRSYFQYLDRGGKRGLFPDHCLAVGDTDFVYEKDWSVLGGCSEADLEGTEVVFAGYGITADEYGYDDYEGIDAKGKAVLILRYEPQEKNENSKWRGTSNTRYATFRSKMENAREHGAVAVFFVNGPLHHDPDHDPLSGLSTRTTGDDTIPIVHVRKTVANGFLEPSGYTLTALQEAIDKEAKPASKHLVGVRLDFKYRVGELSRARNVCAFLQGSDPRFEEEVVVVGAHYDHLGLGAYGSRTPDRRGEVYNGADDNASGSVGVIEVAEAIVEGGLRPKRSVLFQLYDAEEKGLIGSRYYVANPFIPLEKTVAMLNMDMIARSDENKCSIIGTGSAKEWEEILEAAEEGSSIAFRHSGGGFGGSDHSSFLTKNIPVLFFFTGIHEQYHTPDDDNDRCNHTGAVEIMKVVLNTLMIVTDREKPLTFQKVERTGRRTGPQLGIRVESPGEGKPGLSIFYLAKGGGAEKAGLQVGDVLLAVDGTEIDGIMSLQTVIRQHKPGDVVKVRFLRGDEENQMEVSLGGT